MHFQAMFKYKNNTRVWFISRNSVDFNLHYSSEIHIKILLQSRETLY